MLAPFIFTFAFALDVYLPSIPAIRSSFNVSAAMVQLTVSLFLLLTGVGQLLAGPISDYLGRKKVILSGVIVFFIGVRTGGDKSEYLYFNRRPYVAGAWRGQHDGGYLCHGARFI